MSHAAPTMADLLEGHSPHTADRTTAHLDGPEPVHQDAVTSPPEEQGFALSRHAASRLKTIEREPVAVVVLGPSTRPSVVALVALLTVAIGGTMLSIVLATLAPARAPAPMLAAPPPARVVVVEEAPPAPVAPAAAAPQLPVRRVAPPAASPPAPSVLGGWAGSGGLGALGLRIDSQTDGVVAGVVVYALDGVEQTAGVTGRVAPDGTVTLAGPDGLRLSGALAGGTLRGTWRPRADAAEHEWLVVRR